ncbi:Phage-related protein [Anaerohalosphaera lusitana]|uniref:Phage-related protein n=1 Tax=Anaerohalosphaera lusitana TaxID=1936003 RepID=A0A1U9NHL9_9BACT|nr:type II toxin-antitoxin system RelE/ParE family toxin [Anaerohalosphaera lusitana]AQT67244.1 Phage-related protein [Anaerohalosphaera lusitana]
MTKGLNNLVDNGLLELAMYYRPGDKYAFCFYVQTSGRVPVKNLLEDLNRTGKLHESESKGWGGKNVVARLFRTIGNLAQGKVVSRSFYKKLDKTLWQFTCYDIRFLAFHDGNAIVLVSGFEKKTQETPEKEKKKARKRHKEYLKRKRQL